MKNPYRYEPGFTIENHRDELIDRLGKAINEINALKLNYESLDRDFKDIISERILLRREITNLEAERDAARLDHTLLSDDYKELMTDVAVLRAERDKLRTSAYHWANKAQEREDEADEALEQNDALKAQLSSYCEQVCALQDKTRREALEEAAAYFERHNCISGWYRSNIVANIRALAAKEKKGLSR